MTRGLKGEETVGELGSELEALSEIEGRAATAAGGGDYKDLVKPGMEFDATYVAGAAGGETKPTGERDAYSPAKPWRVVIRARIARDDPDEVPSTS